VSDAFDEISRYVVESFSSPNQQHQPARSSPPAQPQHSSSSPPLQQQLRPTPVIPLQTEQKPIKETVSEPPKEDPKPAYVYQTQLILLSEMGFTDETRNIELLNSNNGDVTQCLQSLLR